MTDEALDQLLTQQRILIEKLSKKKDFWDKFSSLSTFIGTVLLALIGLYFTTIYKHQEVRVAEAQTIEKFLPHLTGTNEMEKKGAIISIASLDDPTLAARLGVAFASSGSVDALEFIYKQAKGDDKTLVKEALIDGNQKRGDDAVGQQEADIAIKAYSRILELDPEADNYAMRAFAYLQKENYDSALADANRAIEVNPKNCNAYDAMGRAYDGKKNFIQALSNYDKAIQCSESEDYYLDRA
jgi:tetratricopeptide (TPR) repeat protein